MQGYTWSSNQRPSQRYQDRSPPQYQERLPPQYQERSPPQYQERSPPQYQAQFPPNYHAVRNDQPSGFQVQLTPQRQTTLQTRYSNGQQEAANQWNACSGSADSSTFQQNSNGYDWLKRANQIHPQHPFATAHIQQQYPSDNPNAYRYHAQFVQWHDSSPQNYRNTGYSQAPIYWSPQSDHGSSVGDSRGWSSHISNNGSSCSMNNQQQFQAPRMAAHRHHQQQQQEYSRQYSGQKRRRHTQSSSQASQKIPKNQAQSRTEANRTSCNSTTPPSGAQSNVSLPSNNLNQSPVDHNWSELGSNAGPDVSATQPQNNQNAGHQSQGTNNGTCNVNQTFQTTQTSKPQLQPHSKTDFNLSSYADSIIYRLLCSNDNERSNERTAHQNTRPHQSEVCATKRTDNHSKEPFSEPRAQCTVEPPSKRIKYAVIQRDCWNKVTIASKDKSDFGVKSAQTGTHQTSSDENGRKGTSQHNIQYSMDPADCLEMVFALQKAAQQSHKAIAIVPPISQQISNAAPTADTSPKKAESPPLKIDCVWSLAEESNDQTTENDKLSESSSQLAQQNNKSLENATESNIADPDACSAASPVECQNDVQQSDCDSSDPSFDLSSVPVIEHTLEKLMDLAKSLEKTELSAGYPENSESVLERILKLYWNGKASNMLEPLKSFGELLHLSIIYAKDYSSVVFNSIETENLKKLAHCDILKNEMYSSSEEFRSSWLNVDGQPADIEKVISEPLVDDATVFKATSQTFSDHTVVASASLGVNSLTDVPEVSSKEKSVNQHMCSPTDLCLQKAGNDSEEVTAENNGHSNVVLRKESEKETFKKQEDINQNQNFNTEPSDISPLAERSTEKLADFGNAKEVFRQDHEQTRDNASDSPSLSPEDSVSEGVKNSEVSFSTETHCTSMDTWQLEDISDDENPISKEALNNSSEAWLVEDISDDENPVSKEALNNSSEAWLVEDISDDENTGSKEALNDTSDNIRLVEDISDEENSGNREVLLNSSNIWQVEDISANENPGNMDTPSNSSDICAVEDVSADENSSNDSLFMGITVLSSEDAKTFFQQFEKEPECNIKTKSQSNFERPDLVACFDAHSQPNHKYNKANTCSRCGTEIAKSSSTNMTKTDSDADLFCQECWEQAPLFELEDEPYEAKLPGSAAENYSLPCLKLEVNEPNLASTKECIVYEGLKGQKSDCLVKSKLEENCIPPSLQTEVKESTVASNDECIAYEGLAGQKSAFLLKSELGHNCSPPSVELKDKKPNVALPETCIAEKGLTGQKRDFIVKSELLENRSRPSLKLEIKEPTVASTKECIAGQGQSDSMIQSELRQNCNLPSIKLQVEMPQISSPEECIADKGLRSPKRNSMAKSEMGQNHSSPAFELKVKESNFVLPKTCIADEGQIGQNSDCMIKSELVENRSQPSLKLEIKEPTVASIKECIAGQGQRSDSMIQSELRQNCNLPSIKLQVEMPQISSPEECIANEGLRSPKRNSMAKSEMGQNHSSPSFELKVKESNFVLPKTCIADEGQIGQNSDCTGESELGQNRCPQCLKLEVKEPTVASAEDCIADKGLPKSDSMVISVTKTVSEIQGSAERELTKIQPNKQKNEKTEKIRVPKLQSITQCRKPKKTAFSKHKLKSGSTSTGSDDSVLFAPDIVVKMNRPQKKKLLGMSANKRRSGESQNCSKVKKFKEHGQQRRDNPNKISNHRENLEKVSGQSDDTPSQGSEMKPELHSILSVNKIKRTEPKKVRFDLYGSKTEKQYYAPERRYSAPATLTVSDCKDYTDELSAKQKVLNQWSSTFIPKTKKTRSPSGKSFAMGSNPSSARWDDPTEAAEINQRKLAGNRQ
ncbi:hypothetical protein G5714_005014 [Onychostoma macrolepis]|uniref:Uncharacterized protein n=1 Tax=Onychostoma macrolepis TaxID=369639 RepID=A0A7J6D6C9_9TELE|nr:hypothetical protein G5714_005014 [Onychostoma macrolepis]